MSPATLRAIRNTLVLAARDAAYRPHAPEAPGYVCRARQINRTLIAAARAARGVCIATGTEVIP